MEKKINYLARTFEDIKSELISFSKKYYPELADDFNDASVGSWFIDLVSAVGDDLSYHTDRMYQENDINAANLMSSVMNNARLNGIHIPGPKASMCEVELSCELPVNSTNIYLPDWSIAPTVRLGSVVGNSNYRFELTEDVDFKTQFNSNGVSNRKFTPNRDNNGIITGYTITKSTIVMGGNNKVYKKVLTDSDIKPFMEVVLPEKNIMNVESVIFKESSNFNADPQTYEYYIDEEKYRFKGQEIDTYRYFEVESLSDQYIFGDDNKDNDILSLNPDNEKNLTYIDETEGERVTRYYKGVWKPITQKFITEYTDKGYLKLIFGSGNGSLIDTNNNTNYASYAMSKIINNDLLGVLPKAGWTMFIAYRTGGGVETNLAQGSINNVLKADVSFSKITKDNASNRSAIIESLSVNNISPSLGGRDFPSVNEVKNYVKYYGQEQNRCITVKDYKCRLMMIPPKYGCPFRCNAIEDNNKIVIPCLGLTNNGKLDFKLADVLRNNIINYLKHYKTLGDYIELKSGKIYNIGITVNVIINKRYNSTDVVKRIIKTIYEYMDVNNHDMGENIYIGDLFKEVNKVDGVLNIIDLKVYSLFNSNYSHIPSSLPSKGEVNHYDDGKDSFEIDLEKTDNILYSDYDSMYEILHPETDIVVRTKLR